MPDSTTPALLWAPAAWIDGRWRDSVLLEIGSDGHWASVQEGVAAPPSAALAAGPVLSGMIDGHSHAFQRAFAGLAERRPEGRDDFWSWRDRMYGIALRVDAASQRAIATHLFHELLRGGYTQVCEFHYLHHGAGEDAHDGGQAQALALLEAARETGIGMTLLPCIYERSGFGAPGLRPDQRAFRAGAADVLALCRRLGESLRPCERIGIAVHSLRAAQAATVHEIARQAGAGPIHIHAAEQVREVEECLADSGMRPIEWLCREARIDSRWHLVHATHALAREIEDVARCGAGVVLCPSTEANLGDGVPDLPAWLAAGVPLSIGTDSQVTRSVTDEIRLLEYSQRLWLRVRCVAAAPEAGFESTAQRLWTVCEAGGARAAGFDTWGLRAGARADLLVLDLASSNLLGIGSGAWLDALVFSSPGRSFRDVMVGGRWVVRNHRAPGAARAAERFRQVVEEFG